MRSSARVFVAGSPGPSDARSGGAQEEGTDAPRAQDPVNDPMAGQFSNSGCAGGVAAQSCAAVPDDAGTGADESHSGDY